MTQPAGVFRAPDELLLKIALHIGSDTASLRHLALTHRHFRSVAHEALVRSGVVPIRSIPKYILLLSRHPEWEPLITRIEYKDGSDPDPQIKPRQATIDAGLKVLGKVVPRHMFETVKEEFLSLTLWPETWSLLLIASLPNARVLAVNPRYHPFPRAYRSIVESKLVSQYSHDLLFDRLGELIVHRMEVLDIRAEDPNHRYYAVVRIQAYEFRNLKVLSLPGDFVRLQMEERSGRIGLFGSWKPLCDHWRVLPQNLETLRIYCDQETCPWEWLLELHMCISCSKDFSRLRHIQLLFSLPCRSLAHYAVCSVESTRRFADGKILALLQVWAKLGIFFETLFLQHGTGELPSMDQRRYKTGCLNHAIRSVQEETGRSIYFDG